MVNTNLKSVRIFEREGRNIVRKVRAVFYNDHIDIFDKIKNNLIGSYHFAQVREMAYRYESSEIGRLSCMLSAYFRRLPTVDIYEPFKLRLDVGCDMEKEIPDTNRYNEDLYFIDMTPVDVEILQEEYLGEVKLVGNDYCKKFR